MYPSAGNSAEEDHDDICLMEATQERHVRHRQCWATGYTIAKRRLRELRKRTVSFSPSRERTVYKRIRLEYDSDDDSCADQDEMNTVLQPVNCVHTDEQQPSKSRKRPRNESKWKRNVNREAWVQGKSYITRRGKIMRAKSPILDGNLCGKEKCCLGRSSKIDNEARSQIIADYYCLPA